MSDSHVKYLSYQLEIEFVNMIMETESNDCRRSGSKIWNYIQEK